MSRPARTAFDLVNAGMPPALELSRDPPNLRHYAPHPCAPTQDEIDPERDHGYESLEQWFEAEQGYHGGDRR